MTLYYLATPYSKYPAGTEAAFYDASILAGRLMQRGVFVYSPIVHTHPIAVNNRMDLKDLSIWLPFDELIMAKLDAMIVAHMTGWEESRGIAHEIEFFEKAKKPIYDLDPQMLTMTLRRVVDVAALSEYVEPARRHYGDIPK